MPKTVTSSRGILIPRDPSVSPSSLLSTRNTSRLNANVTNANHGPCTRSAGNPMSTLNTMQVNPAMAIATRNGTFGSVVLIPPTVTSRPVSNRTET